MGNSYPGTAAPPLRLPRSPTPRHLRARKGQLPCINSHKRWISEGDPFITFIGVFDEGIYRSFSGDKSERRGRKASKPGLTGIFPKSGALIVGKITSFQFDFEGVPMHGLAVRQDVPGNGVRVIVVVDRAS